MEWKCNKTIEVSDQFGDDTKIEKDSKWQFVNFDEKSKFNLMQNEEGKIIKIRECEFNNFFEGVV